MAKICFNMREFKGSRYRCLLVTHQSRRKVVDFLNSCVQPVATVSDNDSYMPEGFLRPDEAKLGETIGFLDGQQRQDVTTWWLEVVAKANTPNWDIVSTCTIDGKKGLLLIEAKAHANELSSAGKKPPKTPNGEKNHDRISQAIEEANVQLKTLQPGWALSRDSHYQLSNRFAWAWKVASLGVPVVLVYLGFLNADDGMGNPFQNDADWKKCMHNYADNLVRPSVWKSKIDINGIPLIPLIRSVTVDVAVTAAAR